MHSNIENPDGTPVLMISDTILTNVDDEMKVRFYEPKDNWLEY